MPKATSGDFAILHYILTKDFILFSARRTIIKQRRQSLINAIIPCGGIGKRTGLSYNKIFYPIDGAPLIVKTVNAFLSIDEIKKIIIVYNENDKARMEELFKGNEKITLTAGGESRSDSVKAGLNAVDSDTKYVVIHDGARPFVTDKLIKSVMNAAKEEGGATLYTPVTDTIKHVVSGEIESTPNRDEYVLIETPQAFDVEKLRYAYAHTEESLSDDTQVYERFFGSVKLVLGDKKNIKITSKEDLPISYRSGIGYDTHRLVEGRKLVLGGIEIPHHKGLLGHSDADVLTHAVMDSLLNASGERDIGVLFPDTDAKYKDIYSILLLEEVYKRLTAKGYSIVNVSAVVMAEKPKLRDHIPKMAKKLAETLNMDENNVNISATTTEGIGLVGREEGISSQAVCLLKSEVI